MGNPVKQRSVRELGGEIWTELALLYDSDEQNEQKSIDLKSLHDICDLVMAVLARHDGTIVINDQDLPVPPLEKRS